jgi:hypothetical protein
MTRMKIVMSTAAYRGFLSPLGRLKSFVRPASPALRVPGIFYRHGENQSTFGRFGAMPRDPKGRQDYLGLAGNPNQLEAIDYPKLVATALNVAPIQHVGKLDREFLTW